MVDGNVGLAFGLVIAAGLCTCLGASLVFCTNLTNTRVLAGALGASAGVMTYVSMVEIFTGKSVSAFVDYGLADSVAMRYATFSFFAGVVVTWLLDKLVHCLSEAPKHLRRMKKARKAISTSAARADPTPAAAASLASGAALLPFDVEQGEAAEAKSDMMVTMELEGPLGKQMMVPPAPMSPPSTSSDDSGSGGAPGCCDGGPSTPMEVPAAAKENPEVAALLQADQAHHGLARMGALAAVAVGLHNLPEGLATFIAALASPSAGIAIAVAIALHNIPEGVVVAMPIYYATGSKWKGFAWSFVSGLAEPVGGLLGYFILASTGMNPLAYALMFGLVAGMMVYIAIVELLPTALRYDPEDKYTTTCFVWGMVVMAASLLLFAA